MLGRQGDGVELLRAQLAVLADGEGVHELAHLLRVLAADAGREVAEQAGGQLAGVVEDEALLLGPRAEHARPVLVVVVEALTTAGDEELAAALEALLDEADLLGALGLELLALGEDLPLELVQVGLALLEVDVRADVSREVEDLLELLRRDVEQVADAARDTLEEPDVRDGRGQVDVTHALAPHLLAGDLDAAALADDALVADALVLAAVALPVLGGTEDALAEEAVLLGLERAVVDGLRLGHLAGRPGVDVLRGGQADLDVVEIVDVDQRMLLTGRWRGNEMGVEPITPRPPPPRPVPGRTRRRPAGRRRPLRRRCRRRPPR